jgi:predicted nuclease of predicted toxin-antitoxin system
LNPKQIDTIAIDNVTTDEVKRQLTEKVYKKLESIFEAKIISWNSVAQSTAKRFVTIAVEQDVEILKRKLAGTINNSQTSNIIVQRFVLINNLLKIN